MDCFIKIKDDSFKFEKTLEVSNFGLEFFSQKGCLKINPITYVHLINIVDIFLRPIAAQGDL